MYNRFAYQNNYNNINAQEENNNEFDDAVSKDSDFAAENNNANPFDNNYGMGIFNPFQ
jgi:hypothetical protein